MLKTTVRFLGAAEIARRLNLHPDTVELWYRKKDRSIPVYALRKICVWTGQRLDKFRVFYLGGRGRREIVPIPSLNAPFAYLLGIIVGDGHLYETRVHIACDERTLKEAVAPCVSTLGLKCIIRQLKWKGSERFTLEINSRPLVWFLRDVCGIPIGKKTFIVRIPKIVKMSDLKTRAMFLRGLFDADGYIDKKGYIGFCSASSSLYEDVIQMLGTMGIKSICKRIDIRRRNPVYHLRLHRYKEVEKFSELIGFSSPSKRQRLINRLNVLKS